MFSTRSTKLTPISVFWLFSNHSSTNWVRHWKLRSLGHQDTLPSSQATLRLSSHPALKVRFPQWTCQLLDLLSISLDYDLGTRRGALFPLIGEGIFTQDGDSWKHSRELLRRPFLKNGYQDLRGFSKPLDDLVATLKSSQGVVDLQPLFFRFTLSTTTSLIFGQPIKFEDDNKNDFAGSFDYASKISSMRMRLVDFYWAYSPSRYITTCRNVKQYADGFVKRAIGESDKAERIVGQNRYAFVEDLYHELKDPVLVRDQLVNVLLAGRDTTACLLSWTL